MSLYVISLAIKGFFQSYSLQITISMRNRSFIFEIDRYLVSSDILTEFLHVIMKPARGAVVL